MNAAVSKAKPKTTAAPPPSKPDAKPSSIQVVESGSCPTLSGQSTLRYEVGKDKDAALHLRIVSNSGRGKFHRKFIPLSPLMEALERSKEPITSGTLRTVCKRMSANQGGFLLSVFLGKGLIERLPGKERGYALSKAFPLAKPGSSDASAKPLKGKASLRAKQK